jgi:hypothetical protein
MTTTTALLTSELVENLSMLRYRDVVFFNFEHIFSTAYRDSYKFCNSYNIDFSYKNKDIKKILLNYFIVNLSNYYLTDIKSARKIGLITTNDHILSTYDTNLHKICKTITVKVQKLLPIHVVDTSIPFRHLHYLLSINDTDAVSMIEHACAVINNYDTTQFSFRKLKYFLKKEGYHSLYNTFTTNHKIKQSFLYK